ncbi:AAA family ATPase [Mycobacterium sp. Dal123C01]|uniref:AAA family ATPase n=1 Tax=Mycobacterium sp. Dal123C01 TaxID=3457577 RepID=UPI00403EE49A
MGGGQGGYLPPPTRSNRAWKSPALLDPRAQVDVGAKVTGPQQSPPHLRDRLLSVSQLQNLRPVEPLIEGLLYRNTLAQLSGPPGSYKSFAAIAMSCALAAGKSFGDFVVPGAGTVVYVAAEGASGLTARVLAWCEVWGVDVSLIQERLFFLDLPLQLGDPAVVDQAIEVVAERNADLVVLDTRARCTLGLEENSATQQGSAIDAADSMRPAADCTVLGIHHSSRSGTAGRGSNAWDGAVWSDLRMEGRGLQAMIHCEKHKDVPAGCDHPFALVPHTVSPGLMPNTFEPYRSTLVISNATAGLQTMRANSQLVVLEIIWNSAPPEGFTGSQVVELAKGRGVGKSSVYFALKTLVEEGFARNVGTPHRSRYVRGERQP